MINKELKKYIKKEILPKYTLNDEGHNIKHITMLLKEVLSFQNMFLI